MSDPRLDHFDPADLPEGFPWAEALVVCTDGSGNTKTGVGAWAFVAILPPTLDRLAWLDADPVDGAYQFAQAVTETTNNQMEMQAVIEALRFVHPELPVVIVCDSQYVVLGATTYIHGWRAVGWKKNDGKQVKNRDRWEYLDALQTCGDRYVHYHHVRGHKGHPGNERADKLCTHAVKSYLASQAAATETPPTS